MVKVTEIPIFGNFFLVFSMKINLNSWPVTEWYHLSLYILFFIVCPYWSFALAFFLFLPDIFSPATDTEVPMDYSNEYLDSERTSLMDDSDEACSIPGSFSPDNSQDGASGDQRSDTHYISHSFVFLFKTQIKHVSPHNRHSANIPLMRVVQSVRNTTRRSSTAIKEGWMVHYSNKDTLVHCFSSLYK